VVLQVAKDLEQQLIPVNHLQEPKTAVQQQTAAVATLVVATLVVATLVVATSAFSLLQFFDYMLVL
jgi:hypothetical protein